MLAHSLLLITAIIIVQCLLLPLLEGLRIVWGCLEKYFKVLGVSWMMEETFPEFWCMELSHNPWKLCPKTQLGSLK